MFPQEMLLKLCLVLSVAYVSCNVFPIHKRDTEDDGHGMDHPLDVHDETRFQRDAASLIKFCLEVAPAVAEMFERAFKLWREGNEARLEREACCQFYRNQTCFKANQDPFYYNKTLEECKEFSVTKHCSSASSITFPFWMILVSLSFTVWLTKPFSN